MTTTKACIDIEAFPFFDNTLNYNRLKLRMCHSLSVIGGLQIAGNVFTIFSIIFIDLCTLFIIHLLNYGNYGNFDRQSFYIEFKSVCWLMVLASIFFHKELEGKVHPESKLV